MVILHNKENVCMERKTKINSAQYEIINMLSCINSEKDVEDLKNVIVQFLNSRLQNEIDKLWENGTLNEDIVNGWRNEHMRTPYNSSR